MLFRRLVRAVLVLAALLALGGALTPPFASAVWSRYQVWEAFPLTPVLGPPDQVPLVARRPAGLDPWGRPWALHLAEVRDDDGTGLDADVRSVGPDGVDDGGNGDDVVVDPTLVLVALAPSFGLLFSLLVLWLVAVVQALAGGRGPALWHDVARAAVAASPVAAATAVVVAAVGTPRSLLGLPLVVPVELAAIGAAGLVATLAALGWRVRRGVRRRARARVGSGLGAATAAVVACVAALHGAGLRAWSLEERQLLLRARRGDRPALEAVLRIDEELREAFLAQGPDVEWQRLPSEDLLKLAERGPRSTPALARALRWDGHAANVPPVAWRLLLARDVELRALAAALTEEPHRHPGLLLTSPTLAAALLGVERARAAIRPLERAVARGEPERPFQPSIVYPEQAEQLRRRAGEALRRLSGPDDGWLLVRVHGLTRSFAQLRCGAALDGAAEVTVVAGEGGDEALVVLGPLPAAPAGRRLVVRDLAGGQPAVALDLPAQRADETLWVEANVLAGTAGARSIRRP